MRRTQRRRDRFKQRKTDWLRPRDKPCCAGPPDAAPIRSNRPHQAPAARVDLHRTLATSRETIHPTNRSGTPNALDAPITPLCRGPIERVQAPSGRRMPRPRATRCRAPRASLCRERRAGDRPRPRKPGPSDATSRPPAPACSSMVAPPRAPHAPATADRPATSQEEAHARSLQRGATRRAGTTNSACWFGGERESLFRSRHGLSANSFLK